MDPFQLPVRAPMNAAEEAADRLLLERWQEKQSDLLNQIAGDITADKLPGYLANSLEEASDGMLPNMIMTGTVGQAQTTGASSRITTTLQKAVQNIYSHTIGLDEPYIWLTAGSSYPERWQAIEADTKQAGYKACLLIPVKNNAQQTLAMMAIFQKEAQVPTPAQSRILQQVAALIRLTVQHRKTEERLVQLKEREKIAREQVDLAERMSHLAVEGAGAGTFHIDLDNNFMVYSPLLAIIMTGQYIPGLNRSTFIEYIHPDDKPLREKAYEEANRTGKLQYEARVIWKDGSIHWVKILGQYIPDANGEFKQFAGIALDITAETAAREQQQKLLSLVNSSNDFMAIGDNEGRALYINPAGRALIGLAPDADISQYKSPDFYPAETYAAIAKTIPQIMETGKWSGPILLKHFQTGESIPGYADFITVRDPFTHEIIGRGSTVRDMRPQIAAEQAFRQSETRFRLMIEHSPVAMGVLKGDDCIIEVANEALKQLWDKQREEVVGLPLLTLLPELKDQPFTDLMRKVMTTGQPHYGFETLARLRHNGEMGEHYFNFVYAPYRDGDTITGVQLVASEVTAQVMAKRSLEASEERFRNLVYGAPVPIAIYIGLEMRILIANEAVLKTWARDASVIGKTFLEALPELESTPWLQKLQDVYTTGIPFEAKEQRVDFMIDGRMQLHYFNFSYKPLYDGESKIYGVINTAADVTSLVLARQQLELSEQGLEQKILQRTEELSRANQQLTQSNEELEQFAYVASHDLQEPLRKIRIFSDLLLNQLNENPTNPNTQIYLGKVMSSAERMSNLIMDLLNFSRITKKQDLIEPVSLTQVLQQVSVDFELMIRQKEAVVTIETLPVIECIPLQINQLFYNLVGNALKFTQRGRKPHVRISARAATQEETISYLNATAHERYVLITISDNGIGFEPEMAGQIFTIFQRLHTRYQFEGTGIGLALCKRIVLAHGGNIWATGVLNEGAVFNVLLPLKQV